MGRLDECRQGPDEEIGERLDVVMHKLKFMGQVPVYLYAAGGADLTHLLEALEFVKAEARGAAEARFAVVAGPQPVGALMQQGYALKEAGRISANTQVVLLQLPAGELAGCEGITQLAEDCADMLHPGHFYFGGEGERWLRLID